MNVNILNFAELFICVSSIILMLPLVALMKNTTIPLNQFAQESNEIQVILFGIRLIYILSNFNFHWILNYFFSFFDFIIRADLESSQLCILYIYLRMFYSFSFFVSFNFPYPGPYVTGVDVYITEDYLNGTFRSCSQVIYSVLSKFIAWQTKLFTTGSSEFIEIFLFLPFRFQFLQLVSQHWI